MNEHEINLSIIREVKQHLDDNEGMEELLNGLGSPKKSCPQSEIEIDLNQLYQSVDVRKENQLTVKLKMIHRYIQAQGDIQLDDYMLRKFKNLVRCMQAHQTTLEKDYYLLFEILLITCRRLRTDQQFLHQLSLATSKGSGEEASPFSAYLEIIYHLIRIKMANYETRNMEVVRLKEYYKRIEWKGVQWFPLRDILRLHFMYQGEVKDSQFLSGLMNEYRELKLEISKQVDTALMLKESEAEETKTGSSKIELHKPKLEISRLIEQAYKSKSLNNQLQDSINAISIIQIKKSPQGKTFLRKLLHLSFKHLKLMSSSIEKALYIFQIQQFINETKNLLKLHSTSQNLADSKEIIKKQLKKYSGKDSLYYWSKIQG